MTLPTNPGETSPFTYPSTPAEPIAYDESAYELPVGPLQARPPEPPARSDKQQTGRGAGRGSIVLAAVLAAGLAAGGTFGIVELTLPAAGQAAATNAPAKLTSTSTTVPLPSGAANQPIVQIAAAAYDMALKRAKRANALLSTPERPYDSDVINARYLTGVTTP